MHKRIDPSFFLTNKTGAPKEKSSVKWILCLLILAIVLLILSILSKPSYTEQSIEERFSVSTQLQNLFSWLVVIMVTPREIQMVKVYTSFNYATLVSIIYAKYASHPFWTHFRAVKAEIILTIPTPLSDSTLINSPSRHFNTIYLCLQFTTTSCSVNQSISRITSNSSKGNNIK